MSAAESARGGSLSAISPASFIAPGGPAATASTRKPLPSSSFAAALAAGAGCARPMTTAKAPFTIRSVAPAGSVAVASDIFFAGSNGTNLHQCRRVGDALGRRGGANGPIDRVLPAIGAGQRRQRQNMRFVEPGHGMNAS